MASTGGGGDGIPDPSATIPSSLSLDDLWAQARADAIAKGVFEEGTTPTLPRLDEPRRVWDGGRGTWRDTLTPDVPDPSSFEGDWAPKEREVHVDPTPSFDFGDSIAVDALPEPEPVPATATPPVAPTHTPTADPFPWKMAAAVGGGVFVLGSVLVAAALFAMG